MSKAFGGEVVKGSSAFAGDLVPGFGEVMMVGQGIRFVKKIEHHHQNKKQEQWNEKNFYPQEEERKRQEAELQRKADEQARLQLEAEQKQAAIDKEEADKKKQKSIEDYQNQQNLINQQRQQVDFDELQRIYIRDNNIMARMEREREERLDPRAIPRGMEPDLTAVDYLFGGAMGVGTHEPRQGSDYTPINPGDDWVDERPLNPGQPGYPGGGPSGGSGGMPSGGSGGGQPPNGNINVPNYRDPNYGRGSRNPYADLIQQIAQQIRQNVNDEKPQQKPESQDTDNYPGKDGAGTRKYYDEEGKEIPPPLGSDPATWSPTGKTDQNPIPQQYNDELHLMENELLAVIAAQGNSELTNEETLKELNRIEAAIPQQVQVNPSAIYSSQIVSF